MSYTPDLEQTKTLLLTERNHEIDHADGTIRKICRRKITEVRRAKHDVRHHITLMQEYLKYEKLYCSK